MARTSETDTEIDGTSGEWLQGEALRTALWAARQMPYERRVPLFGSLARRASGRLTGFRQRMLENLDYVWPDVSENRRRRIADEAADNFGRALIEHFSMRELAERMTSVRPGGAGAEALSAAQADGRPLILLTGHFGNYESIWPCLIARGLRLGGFYRPMSNPYINDQYVRAAEFPGAGPLFSQDRAGMGRLLRHLKGGGGVLMLNDLYVGSGVEMEFLGKRAMTALSAAELALRLDAPMFPVFATRQADGLSFEIEVEPEIQPSDPETMTAAFNRAIEARIEAAPGQWFWIHRRWKRKWNRGKGMEPGLHPAALPRRKAK